MSMMVSNCGNCKNFIEEDGCKIRDFCPTRPEGFCCVDWQAKTPENNVETTTNDDLFAMIKDLQKANIKLTKRVSKLEDKVGKLEETQIKHENAIIKVAVELEDRIRKLEQTQIGVNVYGKPIKQYANEDHFKVKLEKPKQNKTTFDDECKECPEYDRHTGWCNINGNCYLVEKPKQSLLSKEEIEKSIINGMNYDCDDCENYGISNDKCIFKNGCSGYAKYLLKTKNKEPKQEKWIVHRTLRNKGRETYVGKRTNTDYDDVKCGYVMIYQKEYATRYEEKEAIKIRDELNEQRVGKRYLWVISKVEE